MLAQMKHLRFCLLRNILRIPEGIGLMSLIADDMKCHPIIYISGLWLVGSIGEKFNHNILQNRNLQLMENSMSAVTC